MTAMSYADASEDLAATMTRVCEDRNPVIVTRDHEPAVVLIALEDYQALEKSSRGLRSPTDAERLVAAMDELDRGGGVIRNIDLNS